MVCEQLNSTNCHIRIFRDIAFAFNFPNGVLKHLIKYLKPIQNISTSGNTLESGNKQFFIGNWKLRNFSMIGYVMWQNSRDNAFLRVLYTSLFSILKNLACLSEAMKLFSYSFRRIVTLPPMWKELKKLWPFMNLLWPTMPPSVNSGAKKIGWKLDICAKESFQFLRPGRFSRFEEPRKEYTKITDDLDLHNQILLEVFSSILKMTQKIFLLSYQTSLVKFLMSYLLQFCDSIASYGEIWNVVSFGWDLTKICALIICIALENGF